MKRLILSLITLLNVVYGCNGQNGDTSKKAVSQECITLNNKATVHINKYFLDRGGEIQLDTALSLLKQAVNCDSSYLNAYLNMMTAYEYMKNYNEEMKVTNKILVIANYEPGLLIKKGILFEKMNQVDSARQTYSLAKSFIQQNLLKTPDDFHAIYNLIVLKAVTDGKDAAVNERNQQAKKHPQLSSKLVKETFFLENFNRTDFVGVDTLKK